MKKQKAQTKRTARPEKTSSAAPPGAIVAETGHGLDSWMTVTDRDRLDWLQGIFESGTGNFWMELWVEYKNHRSLRAAIDHARKNW